MSFGRENMGEVKKEENVENKLERRVLRGY
jgi:hypothetical protein